MSDRIYTRMYEGWEAPPELTGPTPRKVKWTKTGRVNLWAAGFVVVFGFLIVLGIFGNALGDHQLKTEAQQAEGSVTRKWIHHGRNGTYHNVAYSFAVAGRTYWGESHVPNAKWQKLSVGSALAVRYVPTYPSNNLAVIAFEPVIMPYWVPLAVFAVWIIFIWLSLYDVRKERALLQYGQPAAGVVVTNNEGKRIPKYGWVTGYEFQLPDGSIRKGTVQRDRTWRRGQTVSILYDPKRTRRSGIYPLRMTEIAE